jgi:hypothetical protein
MELMVCLFAVVATLPVSVIGLLGMALDRIGGKREEVSS